MKKNILVFCSWLEVNSNIGIFFREQAELVSGEYNPILVVFKSRHNTRRKNYFLKSTEIVESKTKENISVLEIYYSNSYLFPKKINSYYERMAMETLNNYLNMRDVKITFIHAQSLFDAGIWAYQYFKKYNIPYIVTEHNQLSFFNVGIEKCQLIKKSLQNSTLNLVVSNDKIRQFVTNGLFFDFKNIGNLINNRFSYKELNVNNIKPKFITVGAFAPSKDQKTLFKALEIVDRYITNRIEFTWIGYDGWGGNYDLQVKELLANYHFENIDVVLIPLLGRDEIAEYLHTANLFLFSSISEGMPVSVLEALASGLPVFTSNCGGVDEVIDKNNGEIYQIGDYKRLSELILDFLNNNFDFNAKKISENIIQKFGEKVFREKLLVVYNSIS